MRSNPRATTRLPSLLMACHTGERTLEPGSRLFSLDFVFLELTSREGTPYPEHGAKKCGPRKPGRAAGSQEVRHMVKRLVLISGLGALLVVGLAIAQTPFGGARSRRLQGQYNATRRASWCTGRRARRSSTVRWSSSGST